MRPFLTLIVIASCAAGAHAQADNPLLRQAAKRQAAGDEPAAFGHAQVVKSATEILDALEQSTDFDAATAATNALMDRVINETPTRDADAYIEAALTRRLVAQLFHAGSDTRVAMLPWLREHRNLATTIAFLVKPEERPGSVYQLLERLRAEFGDELDNYAALAAAVSVVHDQPLTHRINENSTTAPDAVEIYRFYHDNEKKMLFGVRDVPAELLVFVVDNAVSLDEMNWALDRYSKHQKVGSLFFKIDYDYDHFRQGTPKKVTTAGWNLPNILQYGGVCADQAYFAVAVGKSIGVPTAYTWGAGASARHAWVGFLEARGRQGWWNFDVGRYREYQGVRGNLLDPQTRDLIPDGYAAVLAEMIGSKPEDRHAATAYTDAALRLLERDDEPGEKTIAKAEDLVEAGLRRCAGYAPGWFVIRDLAERGALTLRQKKTWADRLEKMCGRKYPDFTFAILKPMIQSIEDVNEQAALWESALRLFPKRKDLAAECRVLQGRMWQEADRPAKAGRCYEDVVSRFADDGPFVITALFYTEQMLVETGREAKVVTLYERAWSNIPQPKQSIALTQSNWYRVGELYAQKLDEAGRSSEADGVRDRLGAS